MVDSSLITVTNVVKRYRSETVLKGIDLNIGAGECVVLVGHNGAGKTTLMKLILGLIKPTEGAISVLGFDPSKDRARLLRKGLGYLPERVAFYESMTGLEVLRFYARLKSEPIAGCDEILESVGLFDAKERPVQTYSKGMKQRLGLAQALLGDPQFLLLDEPTSGLDPVVRRQVYDLINRKCAEGKTAIISSHSLNEVESQADHVVIMNEGEVIVSGSMESLYEQSGLPTIITLSVQEENKDRVLEQINGLTSSISVKDSKIEISCSQKDKMTVLQAVMSLDNGVDDIQISAPKLDDIYLHFIPNKVVASEREEETRA
ncbi:MAG: ABC transporter ATP-binding protein [Gammaproteobacteria bacterium]|nr:MAG: ABC transporter ATP-binding protein [Gammaproteobacteria bacterium]RLA24002.1 MAG: ABC transporter ATP-binding protein [Gammaproteobacteria bacterium]